MWLALSGALDRDLASKLKAALARARFVVVDLAGRAYACTSISTRSPAGSIESSRAGARLVIARPRR